MTGHRAFAEAGGLMAYGTNFFDQYKRAAVPPVVLAIADEVIE